MRQILMAVLALVSMGTTSAAAYPAALDVERLAKTALISVTVPPEWDGTWTVADSVYHCDGTFIVISAATDTLCGGKEFSLVNSPLPLTCTGTADATTLDATCSGSGPSGTDCTVTEAVAIHGTRTGDSYFVVSTFNISYSGAGCGGALPQCIQVNSHGTRTSSAPVDFCATPTRPSTWGRIKVIYR